MALPGTVVSVSMWQRKESEEPAVRPVKTELLEGWTYHIHAQPAKPTDRGQSPLPYRRSAIALLLHKTEKGRLPDWETAFELGGAEGI